MKQEGTLFGVHLKVMPHPLFEEKTWTEGMEIAFREWWRSQEEEFFSITHDQMMKGPLINLPKGSLLEFLAWNSVGYLPPIDSNQIKINNMNDSSECKKEVGSIATSIDLLEKMVEAFRDCNSEMNGLLNRIKIEPGCEAEAKTPGAGDSVDERLVGIRSRIGIELDRYRILTSRVKSWL